MIYFIINVFSNIECSNIIGDDGIRIIWHIEIIRMRIKCRSLKGGSRGSTKEN